MADSNACEDTLLPLEIRPVDTLFFRDARPFDAASRAASGLPMPQTLAGALCTLLLERHGVALDRLARLTASGTSLADALAEFGADAAAVSRVRLRGPWFSRYGDVLLPAPVTLRQEKQSARLVRLDPRHDPPPGWQPPIPGVLPLWRHGRVAADAVTDFLTLHGVRRFLEGGVPEPADVVPSEVLYAFEDRTGIGIDAARNTAAEGLIYAIRMLALQTGVGLYAEISGSAAALRPLTSEPVLMRFGGEGRHVAVRTVDRAAAWPSVPARPERGRLILLTTPAPFDGWRPSRLQPLAAAVRGHQAVSGWDLAKGAPKPNRFLVPAGSVYFLAPGTVVPEPGLVSAEDTMQGWGNFLEGNWNHV